MWLQSASYAFTSGYAAANGIFSTDNLDVNGRMGWTAANSGTDCGYNVDTAFSELAYMYHNKLGLTSQVDAFASGNI